MSINERKGRAIGQKDSEADASQEDNVVMETAMNSDGNGGSSKFIVRGHIIDKPSGKAASDVRAQAFVKHKESNFCPEGDSTQSDAEGFYQIEFSAATFKENDLECDGPVLVVKAYNQKDSLIGKSKSIRIVNRETELNVDVTLYRVDVSVLDVNNKPVPKIIVKAFDRDLRKPQPLGACETNEQGKCYIDYSLVDFQKGDLSSNKSPWLIVEARKEPDGAVLVSQEFRKAESIQKVNLVVTIPGTTISEWQRLNNIIPPLLKGQGTPPSTGSQSEADPDLEPFDLTSTDIDFIVLETELDRAAVEAWVASSKMVRDAILLLTDAHPCEQAIIREQGWPFFYSFARQGFANDLEAVLRESATKWERAWRAALSSDQVPPLDEEHLKQLVTILELLQRLRLLDPVQSRDSSIVQVLAQTPLPAAVALDALTIFQERGLSDTAAFLKLVDSHPNAETDIKIFVRGVRVHQLVSGHAGLSRLLNSHLDNTNGSDTSSCCFVSKLFGSSTNFELDSIGPLALLPSTEWITLGEKASVSQSLTLRLQAKVEGMYPLTALQTRITKEDVQFPVPGSEIITFIKNNEETAESILSGSFPLKHLNSNETPVIYKTLSNVGLFQRFGLNMETSAHLMGKGITSVGIAVSFGREAVRDAVGDLHPSEVAIEFAEYLVGKAEEYLNSVNKFLTTAGYEGNVALPWYQDKALVIPPDVKENLPDLTSIFGDLDQCFCKPCESMLSQSAYLVDLLQLLKKIPNAFGELSKSKRRGDIPELPLSCESETEIQHIVLVLGILEKAISETSSETVAYQRTASAVFPWRLPFDRYHAETKAYLAKLNVTRQDLLVLQSAVNEQYLAAETLSIAMPQPSVSGSISEWELITQARDQDALWHTYGFSPNNGRVSIVDPVSSEELIDQPVQGVIKRISVLLDRTGLSLDELERILTTKYVLIPAGELFITNREQCKTSEMRLAVEEDRLEATLDRLHRFIRLHAKLPEWSFEQLDRAIEVTGDVLNDATVIKLAVIERLRNRHALSLEYLLGLPDTENKLRQELELSSQQYILVKAMTGLDLSAKPADWNILEKLCVTLSRLSESGLSVEQVAAAVLPRITLDTLGQNHLPSVKTDEQIDEMLSSLQQRLQSVEAIRSDIPIEAQVVEILTAIFGAEDANKVMKAIDMAGKPKDPQNHPNINSLVQLLSGPEHATHILGDWLLLFSADQAKKILTVAVDTTNNPTINARFEMLLNDIAPRRRERELVAVIAEQCKLPDLDVVACLSFRLLLDPVSDANQKATETAAELFLDESYWTKDSQRLRDWMDRLHRLVAFSAALNFNSELMQLADRVVVGSRTGINWRNVLATAKAVDGDDCVALLDLLWLQRAEQLSKVVLYDLFDQLKNSSNPIQPEVLRSLATRVGISAEQTLAIATQAISPLNADNLRNPHQLRRVFELLLKALYLGADGTPLQQLANLADNVQSANTALTLLQARTDKEKWQEVLQKTSDPLLQQRRDALVAYLMHHNEQTADPLHQQRSANDLYEYYLIDPQIEPCLITTQLLEAITATQLFVQRILFGLEAGIHTSDESIKQQWTWMRNYRVWEANRKVFLFPENWLFPELRDDKSSSFKQLESTLGQSELTQELAQQAFGQFLDDVAQIGQIMVLGMYEDIALPLPDSHLPSYRTLYVIGRTANPPYAYFWRQCDNFGSLDMEWMPWQHIELDIAGDHILPFVIDRQLIIIWPLIKRSEPDADGKSTLEIKFSWSRYNGVRWSQPKTPRDELVLSKAGKFDDREIVHIEGFVTKKQLQADSAIQYDAAILNIFTKSNNQVPDSIKKTTRLLTKFLSFDSYTKISKVFPPPIKNSFLPDSKGSVAINC